MMKLLHRTFLKPLLLIGFILTMTVSWSQTNYTISRGIDVTANNATGVTVSYNGVNSCNTSSNTNAEIAMTITAQAGYNFTFNSVSGTSVRSTAGKNVFKFQLRNGNSFTSPILATGNENNTTSSSSCSGGTTIPTLTYSHTVTSGNSITIYIPRTVGGSNPPAGSGYAHVKTINAAITVSSASSAPTVTTVTPATNITQNAATAGGNVTAIGTAPVTAKGVVWSTSQNPTITTNQGITNNGTGVGPYTSSLTGLTINTTYYYRAYATNSVNTSYGAQQSFTTLNIVAPTVVTTVFNANDTDTDSAQFFGGVTSNGGEPITARGFIWNTSNANLTVGQANTVVNNDPADTDAAFSEIVEGLTPNTQYYYRAYASNTTGGTGYGSINNFYTYAAVPGAPVVANISFNTVDLTVDANGNTATTQYVIRAIVGGNTFYVNATGTLQSTEAWLIGSSLVNKAISGLAAGSEYTFDMKARNGSNVETAWSGTTVVNTLEPTDPYFLLLDSDLAFGNVCTNTSANGYFIFEPNNIQPGQQIAIYALDGFTYSLTENGTYSNGLFIPYNGESSITVYVRFTPAAVQNYPATVQGVPGTININTAGGDTLEIAVSGAGINTPSTVTTGAASGITVAAATLAGQAAQGCTTITAYGIEYSTSANFANGAGTPVAAANMNNGSFTVSLTGLAACTTYYYKAYAADGAGTTYGAQQSFATSSLAAPVANTATDITQTGFTASWNAIEGATGYTLDVSTSPDFETIIFNEDFSDVIQPTPDSPIDSNLSTYGLTGWSGTRVYGENGLVRLGTSGIIGNIITPSINLSGNGGNAILTFRAKYHATDGKSLKVEIAPNGTNTYTQVGSNIALTADFVTYTVAITGGVANSKIRFTGAETAPNRFQLDDVKVAYSGALPEYTNLPVAGTSLQVTGLNPNTTYYYRVNAEAACTSGNSNTVQLQTLNYLTLTSSDLAFGDVCINTEATGSFTFTGSNISGATLNIPALAGYTFSLTEAGTYSSTLVINNYNGEQTTVYVKFSPVAVQPYTGNINLAGQAATPYAGAALIIPATGSGINTPATATAGSATAITMVSATLAGQSVNAACTATTAYGIEYSITNNFVNGSGTQVPASNMDGSGNYSVSVTGLTACTTYYYKAYTTTANGTVYSPQQLFTTTAIAAPVAVDGQDISGSGFTANWESVDNAAGYLLDVSLNEDFGTDNFATDLFISEYVETNISSNKYIEIFNGTGATVDLSDYSVRLFPNGATGFNANAQLSGTLPHNATIVLRNGGSDPMLYTGNAVDNAAMNYNGDDAIALFKISTSSYVDIIGSIGEDPGSQWSSGSNSTLDKTLVRKASVTGGVTNTVSGFPTLATEWDSYPVNTVSNLGTHSYNDIAPSMVPGYSNLDVNNVTSYAVTGLSPFTTYYYRVRAYTANCTTTSSNVVEVTTDGAVTWKIVNGTAMWTPEFYSDGVTPVVVDNTTPVIIETDYNTAIEGVFESESITVNSGILTVAEGTTLVVQDAIVNNAGGSNFVVENGAALIQVNDVDNVGTATVYCDSNELFKLDYTMWSSPVTGQDLFAFSPATLSNRIYSYGTLGAQQYYTVSPSNNYAANNGTSNFVPGRGYHIRMPNELVDSMDGYPSNTAEYNAGTFSTVFHGQFTGVPNNGTVTLDYSVDGGFNGIGNPYTSPINVEAFFMDNESNLAADFGIFFWRKKNNADATSYAILTMDGYAANDGGIESGENPDEYNYGGQQWESYYANTDDSQWTIAPGQGFFVKAATGAQGISFNNAMRQNTASGQPFFRNGNTEPVEKSKLWFNLSAPAQGFSQTTLVYNPMATMGLDFGRDAKHFNNAGLTAIYTLAAEDKLVIQSRPEFDAADVVPVGYRVNTEGEFTITLHRKEGLFEGDQEVYLKDNLLEVTHNIKDGGYTFTTDAGTFDERFEIVYSNNVLDTESPLALVNKVVVYKQDNLIKVSTGTVDMQSVTVYDMRGRAIYAQKDINAAEATLTGLVAQQQVLLVQIETPNGKITKKVIY